MKKRIILKDDQKIPLIEHLCLCISSDMTGSAVISFLANYELIVRFYYFRLLGMAIVSCLKGKPI